MINFQIINSPDTDRMNLEVVNLNKVTFGQTDALILINDANLKDLILELKVDENNIMTASPLTTTKNFWVNAKVYSFPKKILNNDLIKIGNTTIKIISFNFTPEINFEELALKNLEESYNKKDRKIDLLNNLEKLMRDST